MSNLELLNEQWIEMCSDLAVILAEEYGDGSLETIRDDSGDEYYTERSQERYNDYYDEAESIMLRLGLRCPEIFSSHEGVGLHLRVNHESA